MNEIGAMNEFRATDEIGAVAANAPTVVSVDLGPRSYDILIGEGLITHAGVLVASRFPKARVAIVTDETVARLHLAELQSSFSAAGVAHVSLAVAAGEASKSFDGL